MNQVQLFGRLTKEPELRYTPQGTAVIQFTIAVNRNYSKEKRQQAEQQNQATADFIRCIAFGKTAEAIGQYVGKGDRLLLQGSIQTGNYEKDGRTVYTTDVLVQRMELIEQRKTENNVTDGFYPIDESNIPF